MKCPYCGSANNNTSGFHKKELRRGRVRRWRRCLDCGEKFTTIEGTPWQNGMAYCPNCGCRMVEPQESEGEE